MKFPKNNILKHIAALFAMMLSFLPVSAYDFEADGLYYELVSFSDLTCKVVKGDVKYEGDIIIPEKVTYNNRELTVVGIGDEAFFYCESLISISIPDSVTEIGCKAFSGCSSLSSISIPNSVTEIGYMAFSRCSFLSSISIPDSVTEIGYMAFSECSSLSSISIPNSVTEIGSSTFSGCSSLTSISISDSVTEIGYTAFYRCSSLSSISIPNSVTEIGYGAFSGCSSLTSISIPDSVTEIGEFAFSGCSSLTSIRLSDNLKEIKYGTFVGCTSLSSFTIPGRVEKITTLGPYHTNYIFSNCYNLLEMIIEYGENPLIICDDYNSASYLCRWYNEEQHEWTYLPLEKVTINRDWKDNKDHEFPYLKNLTIGERLNKIEVNWSESEKLESVTCYAPTPPSMSYTPTNVQYMNVVVKVPNESLEAYQQADDWKNFWNLQGFDASSINEVNSDAKKAETGRYNLNGQQVNEDYEGIVIIRYSDGSTRKMMQRL